MLLGELGVGVYSPQTPLSRRCFNVNAIPKLDSLQPGYNLLHGFRVLQEMGMLALEEGV